MQRAEHGIRQECLETAVESETEPGSLDFAHDDTGTNQVASIKSAAALAQDVQSFIMTG